MKKIAALAVLALTITACSKNKSVDVRAAANTWNIYNHSDSNGSSQRYTDPSSGATSIGFTAAGTWAEAPYLVVNFTTTPASGLYRVVATPAVANELSFSFSEGFSPLITTSLATNKTATVMVRNGKATIIASGILMQRATSQTADSTTLDVNLTEY